MDLTKVNLGSVPANTKTSEASPVKSSSADHPTTPREQNKKTPKNIRKVLVATSDALKKSKKGKSQVSSQKRPDVKQGTAPITRNAPSSSPSVRGIF